MKINKDLKIFCVKIIIISILLFMVFSYINITNGNSYSKGFSKGFSDGLDYQRHFIDENGKSVFYADPERIKSDIKIKGWIVDVAIDDARAIGKEHGFYYKLEYRMNDTGYNKSVEELLGIWTT